MNQMYQYNAKKSVPNGTLSDYVGTNRLELLTSAM